MIIMMRVEMKTKVEMKMKIEEYYKEMEVEMVVEMVEEMVIMNNHHLIVQLIMDIHQKHVIGLFYYIYQY